MPERPKDRSPGGALMGPMATAGLWVPRQMQEGCWVSHNFASWPLVNKYIYRCVKCLKIKQAKRKSLAIEGTAF